MSLNEAGARVPEEGRLHWRNRNLHDSRLESPALGYAMTLVRLPFLTQKNALIFRITHIQNVPWILDHGLHCASSTIRDGSYVAIGIGDLIAKRARRPVPVPPGGTLSDYIPFYFTPRSVMLLKIVTGHGVPPVPPQELVIIVSSLRILAARDMRLIVTDRHASLAAAQFVNDLRGLENVDWRILRAGDFRHGNDDPERHERYQAEALVHSHLPTAALERLVCYGTEQQAMLAAETARRGLALDLEVHRDWFFG